MLGLLGRRETGLGVRVAVIDTGIDESHPDFPLGSIDKSDSANFVGQSLLNGPALVTQALTDVQGHGTHVAGIIAGRGKASQRHYEGVAPDATLVILKTSNKGQHFSNPVIGALTHAVDRGVDIVNYSAGTSLTDKDGDPLPGPWVWGPPDPLARQFMKTAQSGVLCIAAAGNEGPDESTINQPAGLRGILAVGACDHAKDAYQASSRGPYREWRRMPSGSVGILSGRTPLLGTVRRKPDLAVPGVDIWAPHSAFVPNSSSVAMMRQERASRGGRYVTKYGTSMATAVASGLAACLLERLRRKDANLGKNPGDTLRHLMIEAARLTPCGSPNDVGAGLLRWPELAGVADRYATSRRYRLQVAARVFWS